jgi:hypothetical protein
MTKKGCWMLDTGYWMLDAGYWILDTGCWMLDADPDVKKSFDLSSIGYLVSGIQPHPVSS